MSAVYLARNISPKSLRHTRRQTHSSMSPFRNLSASVRLHSHTFAPRVNKHNEWPAFFATLRMYSSVVYHGRFLFFMLEVKSEGSYSEMNVFYIPKVLDSGL